MDMRLLSQKMIYLVTKWAHTMYQPVYVLRWMSQTKRKLVESDLESDASPNIHVIPSQ